MAKELPYFKFNVSEWILGRISDQSDKVQGAFILAICHYWHKKCDYFIVDFKKKLGKNRYDLLLNLKFIEEENDKVFIDFLDEQYEELSGIHVKRVKSGQAGGIASAQAKGEAKVKHLDKDKNNKKNKIEKEIKKEIAPFVFLTENEVLKLVEGFQDQYQNALNILSNYKQSSGKKYQSDYHALIGWVREKIVKELKTQNNGNSNDKQQQTNIERGAKLAEYYRDKIAKASG